MSSTFARSRLPVLSMLAVVAACSGSTGPQPALSDAEARELFAAMSSVSTPTVSLEPALQAAGGPAPSVILDQTVPCPAGGTAHVTGTSNSTASGTTAQVTEAFADCAASAPGASRTWTMNGAVTVNATTQSTGALAASITGSIRAATAGRSATCDVGITITVGAGGAGGSVTGTVCGRAITGAP
ncbi:MAG: hypothetical protein HY275_03685 [Gemmatimonadetes bacterium]|nr:hypothetical protein [Gemmatimonadota bacterium]